MFDYWEWIPLATLSLSYLVYVAASTPSPFRAIQSFFPSRPAPPASVSSASASASERVDLWSIISLPSTRNSLPKGHVLFMSALADILWGAWDDDWPPRIIYIKKTTAVHYSNDHIIGVGRRPGPLSVDDQSWRLNEMKFSYTRDIAVSIAASHQTCMYCDRDLLSSTRSTLVAVTNTDR